MPIFTDAQMQVFADLLESLGMVDTATIERPSVVNGVATLTEIGTSPCLVQPPSQLVSVKDFEGWQGSKMVTWPILFPLNSNVLEGDIITVKGQKMEVQVKKVPRSFAVYDEVEVSGVRG
jgi:hypothetical protein